MLFICLHNDEAANAEDVPATQFYRPPFELHAHGAGVIVYEGNVRDYGGVDLGTHCFGEIFRKLRKFDLLGECGLDA